MDEWKYVKRQERRAKTVKSPRILAELSRDKNYEIRTKVAWNLNTPVETLVELSRDKHYSVRSGVALNRNTPPETLAELSRDQNYWVPKYVAQHRNTPVNTLAELSLDQDEYVSSIVAKNPKWKRLKEAGILDQAITASKYLGIL